VSPAAAERGYSESVTTTEYPAHALEPGASAPGFELRATPDQSVSLADFTGRRLIMAFYPADWSPICTDQMSLYNEVLPEFRRYAADLVGISIDHAWCHVAFAQHRNLHFPLLADFHPKGDVAQRYGVFDDGAGMSKRALFVVDERGTIRWSHVSPVGVNPGADGILIALESMASEKAA
jgi:peroxiredoxin